MNIWTKKSIELASQRNYLDLLYKVYPMSQNLRRELPGEAVHDITRAYNYRNNNELLKILLKQEIFPIKDSYVAYFKRDKTAIARNPATVQRLSGMLREMGLDNIIDAASAPKETNRQIGPLFKNWVKSGALGVSVIDDANEFLRSPGNAVLDASDVEMEKFAHEKLGYRHNKGLDFVGKFGGKFVIGEAKFLTDFGGHQNAQFNDAVSTMRATVSPGVKTIAILDGVLYIENNGKMFRQISREFSDNEVVVSAVLLRDFLFSL
jgi:hypothetical protein